MMLPSSHAVVLPIKPACIHRLLWRPYEPCCTDFPDLVAWLEVVFAEVTAFGCAGHQYGCHHGWLHSTEPEGT